MSDMTPTFGIVGKLGEGRFIAIANDGVPYALDADAGTYRKLVRHPGASVFDEDNLDREAK